MRKIISFCVFLLMAVPFALSGETVLFDNKELPTAARAFISRYFADAQISHVKVEKEFLRVKKYEVLLTDRTEVEFDGSGNWMEVECDNKPVPAELVPDYAVRYANEYFPGEMIVKIEREGRELEIELANGWSLTFNKKGELIDIDD